MTDEYRTLRHNINMLGRFLGETINDAQGEDILTLIENVRQLSKQSRAGDSQARKTLLDTLSTISNENIIAFGDGLNDIEMLKKCGVGVAMKNALPEVKEQADCITSETNNQNGVVEFLKEYLVEI